MKPELNIFLPLHTNNEHQFDVAFFSYPHLQEQSCSPDSGTYLVMIQREPDDNVFLTMNGMKFRFTPTQANVLGSKLLELAIPCDLESPISEGRSEC